jgi:hypothetical protein
MKNAPEKTYVDNEMGRVMSEQEVFKLAFLTFSPWLAYFAMHRWVNREQRHKDRRK